MRYLGVDYGAKRVGVAVSDESGNLAFPKEILNNDKRLFEKLLELIQTEEVGVVVVGESLNQKNQNNKISAEIEKFIAIISQQTKLPIHKEKEFFTSVEARKTPVKKEKTRKPTIQKKVDAGAAALILQRYLDKINKLI